MRDCLPCEFKIAVRERRKAGYVGYPIDNITDLTRRSGFMNYWTKAYLDHGKIPVRFYPLPEVYQCKWDLFYSFRDTQTNVLVPRTCQSCTCGGLG